MHITICPFVSNVKVITASQHSSNVLPEEERAHGTISGKTYFMFFKESVKSHFVTVVLLVFFLIVEVCV